MSDMAGKQAEMHDRSETTSAASVDDVMEDTSPPSMRTEGDLTGDGGVVKRVVRRSKTSWERPESGDEVSVHYVGRLQADGTQFDSSRDRDEPFEFKLDSGSVIKGWDVAVRSMAKGELAEFTIAPAYAYGEAGAPPNIPPDATLVFEIELLSWKSVRDLFQDGGVIRKTIDEGSGWEHPRDGDELLVHYQLVAVGGQPVPEATPITRTYVMEREPNLSGTSPFIPRALHRTLRGMKKGAVARLECRAEYAREFRDLPVPTADDDDRSSTIEVRLEKWFTTKTLADGQVTVKTLDEGDGWERPNEIDARCTVAINGEPERELVLGDGSITCWGLEVALSRMKKGERAQVTIHDAAYADAAVPRESLSLPMVYEVVLRSFTNGQQTYEMSPEEKLAAAQRHKQLGNALFKQGQVARAQPHYDFIVNAFNYDSDLPPELKAQAAELVRAARLNLAAVYDKQQRPDKVLEMCNKVLEHETSQPKALFRRAGAMAQRGDYEGAERDLRRLLEVEPDNAAAARRLREVKRALREQDRRDKAFFSSMFRHAHRSDKSQQKPEEPATATPSA
ncbi:hypothetical protein CDCA_CDCA16G4136 [Cyanidium caldarium]|uniref:peptidylprolyl isomerase n=1 Tax=Cyanidium caldarium TaxID=2771 RepID=A0AAV9J127_CYACA|nr:hypothetical protein CDCA_CDCA16G4136 [Cyanidium caldarium]